MIISQITKSALLLVGLSVLVGCSSDARFHEIQSARLDECNYKADKEYYECLEQQDKNFEEYKKQQNEQTQ
ncbi:hypothetical protein CWC16_00455 [Pseudoalteromonas sp. S3776]|uniref:hypothetical protein n=1 Tax=Pseudoalteromonas sp. S3776 TaxID=579544 RepID=UPI0011083426|nr:hypothetical protein [Pseudoalteromonas sp. S3776]TMO82269.1 hypothetical protein CWC16_00455 [Pseudoalteromonas sp. S3776]